MTTTQATMNNQIGRGTKLGLCVENLGASQLAFNLIRNVNELCANRADVDVVVFYETLRQTCLPLNCATMHMVEAYSFDGILVATTFTTAEKILRCPSAAARLFYVWDLEWIRPQQKDFRQLQSVYGSDKLQLIARSEDHKKLIEQCWNRPVTGVNEEFYLEKLFVHS